VSDELHQPPLWLRGDRVALGPFSRDLVERYWRWEQEPESLVGYGRQTPESLGARMAGYESQARGMDSQPRFTVYELVPGGTPRPIGTTALRIDLPVRTAEYVVTFGAEGRGRGLAREATTLTLDYAFHVVNLRMVWARILQPNVKSVRALESAGFTVVGRLRRAGYWLGDECDELLMDAVREEFVGPSRVAEIVEGGSTTTREHRPFSRDHVERQGVDRPPSEGGGAERSRAT
jgi:diamine N-acetyltransferase